MITSLSCVCVSSVLSVSYRDERYTLSLCFSTENLIHLLTNNYLASDWSICIIKKNLICSSILHSISWKIFIVKLLLIHIFCNSRKPYKHSSLVHDLHNHLFCDSLQTLTLKINFQPPEQVRKKDEREKRMFARSSLQLNRIK